MFLPPRSSSLRSDSRPLFLRHGLKPTLPADLTTLAPYCSHVLGEIHWRGWNRGGFGLWCLAGRLIYDPLGKLVRITRTFAFADHASMMPQPSAERETVNIQTDPLPKFLDN
jgi:hypothetical protein